MKFVRRDGDDSAFKRLPLTSMIDVFFLLLIYFVVQARFTANESQLAAQLHAQREGQGASASDFQPQIIDVEFGENGEPVYRLGERVFGSKGALTAALRRLPGNVPVFVRAQGEAPWWAAVAAQQACKDAGMGNVSYVPTNP